MEDRVEEGEGRSQSPAKKKGGEAKAPPSAAGGGREEEESAEATPSTVPSTKTLGLCIKQEPSDDIKDFAETTMNELLGWYGYTDKIDQQDTAQLTLESYRPSPSASPNSHRPKQQQQQREDDDVLNNHCDENATEDDDKDPRREDDEECCGDVRDARGSESGDSEQDTGRLSVDSSETSLAAQHRSLVKALNKSRAARGEDGDGCEDDGSSQQCIVCTWCQKPGLKQFTQRTSTGSKAFCSEVCFTQCRRASFKKNKVCDWCKHVRHTVNFVDFQDGEMQLQFCSEKCLNQYKMNIFCTETQEHLKQIQSQLNEERKNAALSPGGASSSSSLTSKGAAGAADAASASASASVSSSATTTGRGSGSGKTDEQILITPELWLAKQRHRDKIPKTEVVEVMEEAEEGEDREDVADVRGGKEERRRRRRGSREGSEAGRERRSESASSERGSRHNRDALLDRKRLSVTLPSSSSSPSSSAAAAAAAAAAVMASYASSLQAGGGKVSSGAARLSGPPGGAERGPPEHQQRSARDRERSRRLFRDSMGDRDSRQQLLHHPADSPVPAAAHQPSFHQPQRPHVKTDKGGGGGTPPPPLVPPMLLPHLNGLGAGLAGLGMFNPLFCSSLLGPVAAAGDGLHVSQQQQQQHQQQQQQLQPPAHREKGDRKEENGTGGGSGPRARSGDRTSLSSTPGAARSSSSPANTASSSGTPNPPHPHPPPPPPHANALLRAASQHPPPLPPGFPPPGVQALGGPAGFPPGLHPPPMLLGLPPFACPPAFLPPEHAAAAAMMGGLLALQGGAAPPPPGHPPPPHPPPHQPQQQQQQQQQHRGGDRTQPRRRADGEVPIAATAGCLNAGVPSLTVMMPFPVVLPIPVPIPVPIPIAPEKIQQFFKERDLAANAAPDGSGPQDRPTSPPAATNVGVASRKTSSTPSFERRVTRSHSPPPLDKERETGAASSSSSHHHHHHHHHNPQHHRASPASLLGHGYRHHRSLSQHSRHYHQHDRRPDSVSSDSSCQSPNLSSGNHGGGGRATPTTPAVTPTPTAPCHEVHGPGCVSCVAGGGRSGPLFPGRPGRESVDSIMALRKTRESADSIMTLRRESAARSLLATEAVSPSLSLPLSLSPAAASKRSLTPVFPLSGATLDLSKRARVMVDENRNNSSSNNNNNNINNNNDDEAMDLSKDSHSSCTPANRSPKDFSASSTSAHKSASLPLANGAFVCSGSGSNSSNSNSNGSAASGKENQHQLDHDMASIDGDSDAGSKVPKIHIIDSRDDPPLAQSLPLPPAADHAYSMRRSLILDAPSIPKPARSPSPERRYVRTVPRDMVEAAKRRCLRARVRTK